MPKCPTIKELEIAANWLRQNHRNGYEDAMACQTLAARLEAEIETRKAKIERNSFSADPAFGQK